ncbi:MAG: hypothetical protein IPJ93_06740 [Bacteroidota bacterium]|nr:MAG: hypothetical protein IPJ93_06740 [Bacteroidota bacterium]
MAKVTLEFIEEALKKYVPHQSIRYCIQWIEEHQINLKITRSRNSKYGDYRPPQRGFGTIVFLSITILILMLFSSHSFMK